MPKYTDIEVNREIYLFVEVFLRPRLVNLPSLRLYANTCRYKYRM